MSASEPPTSIAVPARPPFVEPSKRVPVLWGRYQIRYLLGVAVVVAGYVLTVVIMFPTDLNDHGTRSLAAGIPFVVPLLSATILPGEVVRRLAFVGLGLLAGVFFVLPLGILNIGWPLAAAFYGLFSAALAWAWLIVRERPNKLYFFFLGSFLVTFLGYLALVGLLGPDAGSGELNVGWPELFGSGTPAPGGQLVAAPSAEELALSGQDASVWCLQLALAATGVVGVAWLARKLAPRFRYFTAEERAAIAHERDLAWKTQQAATAAAQAEAEHSGRVEQIKQWEAAYVQAHDGQAPPAGYIPPIVIQSPAAAAPVSGNGFAVAAFIFGLLGGWLGIVFGFIALSQIKRTGQTGRGLATAGIILAFAWIIGYLVLIVGLGLRR